MQQASISFVFEHVYYDLKMFFNLRMDTKKSARHMWIGSRFCLDVIKSVLNRRFL
jgi:hypothetical protein